MSSVTSNDGHAEVTNPTWSIHKKTAQKLGAWSQEKLADRCGFDRTYISMLERGKKSVAFESTKAS